ncbi:hypothetical protein, partial [Salmonella enterica]|uniref:hypothetical protein n=1 Tax=Salmonella enterica TaxID=28901 RepID=UPI0039EC753D
MKSPQEAEITNGIAQNTMLPYLNNLALEGIPGPPIKLQKSDMKLINVTVGTGGDNIGILKDGGHLKWPLALRGP